MIDYLKIDEYTENNRIEAKKSLGGFPKSLWETYSSFANTMGGVILLGVEEKKDHSLSAIDLPNRDKLVDTFWRTVRDKRRVSAVVLTAKDVKKVDYEGKRIVVITVPRASRFDRPVYIGDNPYTGTYLRNGEGDYICKPNLVTAMLKDARSTAGDARVIKSGLSALDFDCVRDFRIRLETLEGRQSEGSDISFLKRIGAAKKGRDTRLHPTCAALLTFGRREMIGRYYPAFSLEYRDGEGGIAPDSAESCNLYSFYFAVCERMAAYADGMAVYNALCEALFNAVANADYSDGRGVTVIKEDDRMEFINGGRFRTDIDEARKGGVSAPRNEATKNLFAKLGIGSGSGSGIPAIYSLWRRKGWATPVFEESFDPDEIRLVLYFCGENAESEQDERRRAAPVRPLQYSLIVDCLTERRTASAGELASIVNLPSENVKHILDRMKKNGLVSFDGHKYSLRR